MGKGRVLASKVPTKAKSKFSTGYINFLVLPLLTQVGHLKTGERGASEEESGPR